MISSKEEFFMPSVKAEIGQNNELRVFLIGNNPTKMSFLFNSLSNYAQVKFMTETAFSVKDGLEKIRRTRPNCILIDDSLDSNSISYFVEALAQEEALHDIPVTLLKTSNYTSKGYNGIQDFLLKDGLSIERLSKALINAIMFRKTHQYLYKTYQTGKTKMNSLLENEGEKSGKMFEKFSWWMEGHKTKRLNFK